MQMKSLFQVKFQAPLILILVLLPSCHFPNHQLWSFALTWGGRSTVGHVWGNNMRVALLCAYGRPVDTLVSSSEALSQEPSNHLSPAQTRFLLLNWGIGSGPVASPWRPPWWLSQLRIRLQCRRPRLDPWVGQIPGEGDGTPLQYSCLENPMERGAWEATVHAVAESDATEQLILTQLLEAKVTSSLEWKKEKKVKSLSCGWLFATPWTVASQPPLSMGFSRQEYWSGMPLPSPWDLPNTGIEPRYPAFLENSSQKPLRQLPSMPPPWVGRTTELHPVVRRAAGSRYSWSLCSAPQETVLLPPSDAWPSSRVDPALVFSVLLTLRNKQHPVWEGLSKPLSWVREIE